MKNFILACLAAALVALSACTTPDKGQPTTSSNPGPQQINNPATIITDPH